MPHHVLKFLIQSYIIQIAYKKILSPISMIRNHRFLQQSLGSQKCPECFSQLQSSNTLKYCPICKKCPTMIQTNNYQPIKNYQSQYMQYLQNRPSSQIKIQSYTRDIACKLNMKLTDHQLQIIVQKVRQIHRKRGIRCKGYREQSAAVLYKLFQDQIRMNLYQFCNKTGINRKKFNRMYVMYLTMLRQSNCINQSEEILKQQFIRQKQQIYDIKNQQEHEVKDNQNRQCSLNQQLVKQQVQQQVQLPNNIIFPQQHIIYQLDQPYNHPCPQTQTQQQSNWQYQQQKQNIHKTISMLYDRIFTSTYLQKFKLQIIKSIIDKTLHILKYYIESQSINCMKKYFRIPAAIFCVVKAHGYKITMKKYIKEVQTVLGVTISQRMISKLGAVDKMIKIEGEEEGSSHTEIDGRSRTASEN